MGAVWPRAIAPTGTISAHARKLSVWMSFGLFSTIVGGFLFWGTYAAQTAAATSGGAMMALTNGC